MQNDVPPMGQPSLQGRILKINGKRYKVKEALKQRGDDPAFESWSLVPLPARAREISERAIPKLVIKVAAHPEKGNAELEDRIDGIQSDVARLQGLRSVPRYHLREPDSQDPGRERPSLVYDENGQKFRVILVRDFVLGALLSKWTRAYEKAQENPQKEFAGLRDTHLWFKVAEMLVDALIPIHNERLVHGDLRPRSIMFRSTTRTAMGPEELLKPEKMRKPDVSKLEVVYLDAEGESPSSYPAAGIERTGTFRRKYDSPLQVFEKQSAGAPFTAGKRKPAHWFAPTDIFSLGMILLELGYGSDVELAPFVGKRGSDGPISGKENDGPIWFQVNNYQAQLGTGQLKRELYDLWKIRRRKLTPAENETVESRIQFICMREVILACLRTGDASARDLEGIRSTIQAFNPANLSKPSDYEPEKDQPVPSLAVAREAGEKCSKDILGDIRQYLDTSKGRLPGALQRIILGRSKDLSQRLSSLTNPEDGFLRIAGREGIIETMISLLNGLRPDECFQALLTPSFFTAETMGLHGRVKSALQLAALRERRVQWVIVVSEEEINTKEVADILEAHRVYSSHIQKFIAPQAPPYGVYYNVVSDQTYGQVLRGQCTSMAIGKLPDAYEAIRNGEGTFIAPDYHGEGPKISALRLWPGVGAARRHKVRRQQLRKAFQKYDTDSQHVRTFYR